MKRRAALPASSHLQLPMKKILYLSLLPLSSLVVNFGCSEAEDSNATGGTAGSDGTVGSGGFTTGSGGASSSGGTVGFSGGAPGSGGAVGSGGETTSSGGADGEGSGGSGTGGETSAPAVPSAGCGRSGRPPNGAVSGTNYIGNFPNDYDGTTPMPLVVGIHACGNPVTQIQSLTNGSKVAEKFVRFFPKSTESCWDYNRDKARFDAAYKDFTDNYCVDTSRVYVTGHSSGAGMAVTLICNGDTRFAGAAPVAAWKACNRVNPIPMMYIQGIADAARGNSNGKDVVDLFVAGNSCSSQSTPFTEVASCTSSFNRKPVDPGCVSYQGCNEPTIWCSHNDEGYNSTDGHYHGWPCFASNAMADFFLSLP